MRRVILRFLKAVPLVLALVGVAAFAAPKARPASRHASHDMECAQCHGSAKKKAPVEMAKCIECHDNQELAAKTAAMNPRNPHNNRHYGVWGDCNMCHHEHKASENKCLGCHPRFTFKVP